MGQASSYFSPGYVAAIAISVVVVVFAAIYVRALGMRLLRKRGSIRALILVAMLFGILGPSLGVLLQTWTPHDFSWIIVVGTLVFLVSLPYYWYFSLKGLCQLTQKDEIGTTFAHLVMNALTSGLYGFFLYKPADMIDQVDATEETAAGKKREGRRRRK